MFELISKFSNNVLFVVGGIDILNPACNSDSTELPNRKGGLKTSTIPDTTDIEQNVLYKRNLSFKKSCQYHCWQNTGHDYCHSIT